MKILKKNQLAILVIAIMLVTAGYLNYTATYKHNQDLLVSSDEGVINVAEIGDAALVNSGDVISSENSILENNSSNNINNDSKENEDESNNDAVKVSSQTIKDDDYFVSSKLERDTMYSQMIYSYTKILENTSISEEQKAISRQEITKINDIKNAIMISENLIKTKGIQNCIIFVNDQSVSVIVCEEEVSQEKIAQIQNIVSRELKSSIENIHIINKKQI